VPPQPTPEAGLSDANANMWRIIILALVSITAVSGWSHGAKDPVNRREAISDGFLFGGGIVSALSRPQNAIASPSSVPTTPSSIILSEWDPLAYKNFPLEGQSVFPPPFLPPITNKATYRYSLGRDTWALEQLLAFANVTATIRTNVVKLSSGGLWVCGPLWPTKEYCKLLDELGEVTEVVLPVNALEHKAAMKQFVQRYQKAKVWVAPGQYGPFGECGAIKAGMSADQIKKVVHDASKTMGYHISGVLPIGSLSKDSAESVMPKNLRPSWINDGTFGVETLYVELPENAGPVSESAFHHKASNTLFVTDAVVCVPSSTDFPIQPIFETYFDATVLSDPTFWPRTVLQAVFLPLRAESDSLGTQYYPGYEALANRLVRAPILRAFADARSPHEVRSWVNNIVRNSKFDRIITAHFASPINASPSLFADAFEHLNENATSESLSSALPPITCQDWSTLDSLNSFIGDNKLGAPVVYDYKAGCRGV